MKKSRIPIILFLVTSFNLLAFEGGGLLKTGIDLNISKKINHYAAL